MTPFAQALGEGIGLGEAERKEVSSSLELTRRDERREGEARNGTCLEAAEEVFLQSRDVGVNVRDAYAYPH